MLALDSTNLREYAIVNQSYKSQIGELPTYDSSAQIKMTTQDNDYIVYESNANSPQLAVFSEIYYNRGWDAYIDGKKSDYIKANYLFFSLAVNQLEGLGVTAFNGMNSLITNNEFQSIISGILGTQQP
jgi:uncharacterized membrane protein YfhO